MGTTVEGAANGNVLGMCAPSPQPPPPTPRTSNLALHFSLKTLNFATLLTFGNSIITLSFSTIPPPLEKVVISKTSISTPNNEFFRNLHLDGRDNAPKQTNHAKEFNLAKGLDHELLCDVGNTIHYGTTQNQNIPYCLIFA